MNSKKLNIIMLVSVLLFCLIFGVAAAVRAARLDELDREHDKQQEQQREQANQNAVDDATTTQKNEQANTGSNNNSVQSSIDFSTFSSMYQAAEKKLNNATNIISTITDGSLVISGPTNYGGIYVDETPLLVNFERSRNATQHYTYFQVKGDMLDGMFTLNYTTKLYSDSAVYDYYFNQYEPHWQTISKAAQKDKFGWTTNDTFHTAAAGAVKSSTTVLYDKATRTYTSTAELIPSVACTKASYFLKGVMDATGPAQYVSSKITVKIKDNGSFESIRYQETFKISVYQRTYDARIDATVVADYTEVFSNINDGGVGIAPPQK